MIGGPPRSTLFPYTTLFRSLGTALEALLGPAALAGAVRSFKPALRRFGLGDLAEAPDPQARLARLDVGDDRSEEHTSELQSRQYLVCRLLLEKKNNTTTVTP